jgi:hypothetical protein
MVSPLDLLLPLSLSLSLPRLSLSLSLPASTERSQIDRGVPSVISTTIAGVAPARPEQRSTPPQSPVAQVPRPRASKEQPRRGPTSRGARRRRPRCRGPDGTRRTAVWHARRCPAAPATPTRCSCSPGSVGCRHRQHLFLKKKQCVIPFRRVDSCALGEGRRRGHRRRREENSSPALSSCVPLHFFYPSFSRPLALIGPCRHCATHSFLIAVGAGLLAYRWYGCFFLLSFASCSSKFSVRQDY